MEYLFIDGVFTAPKKMFLGISRILNVVCYEMSDYKCIEKGKKRYNLLKCTYNFSPGSNA